MNKQMGPAAQTTEPTNDQDKPCLKYKIPHQR